MLANLSEMVVNDAASSHVIKLEMQEWHSTSVEHWHIGVKLQPLLTHQMEGFHGIILLLPWERCDGCDCPVTMCI